MSDINNERIKEQKVKKKRGLLITIVTTRFLDHNKTS